jgi:uncharacterized protein YciI
MKIKIALGLIPLLFMGLSVNAQQLNPKYDKAYADSLGADAYGMRKYVLVILKTGPAKLTNKASIDSLFRGHMKNINQLVTLGKLIVAGPLQKNEQSYRGIFILNVLTIEEARALVATDPAIKSGLLSTELFNWYGSAALPEYLKFQSKIEKEKF